MLRDYWSRIAGRAWRRSLELVRIETWERVVVFAIGLIIPAVAVWFWLDDRMGAAVRLLAALGGSAVAVAALFLYSLLRLPAVIDAEQAAAIATLEAERESAEALKRKRVSLGQLLAQIEGIKKDCGRAEPVNEPMIEEWYSRARQFLADELGEEYLHRFESDAGAPALEITGATIPPRNANLWAWANRRAFSLGAILLALPIRL